HGRSRRVLPHDVSLDLSGVGRDRRLAPVPVDDRDLVDHRHVLDVEDGDVREPPEMKALSGERSGPEREEAVYVEVVVVDGRTDRLEEVHSREAPLAEGVRSGDGIPSGALLETHVALEVREADTLALREQRPSDLAREVSDRRRLVLIQVQSDVDADGRDAADIRAATSGANTQRQRKAE